MRNHATEPASADRNDLNHLLRALRSGAPNLSRRDLMRHSAIAAGAVATATYGVQSAFAAPIIGPGGLSRLMQVEDVDTDQELVVPFNPYGQPVTLDPHYTVNWGPFWVMFPNVWGGLLRFNELGAVEYDLAESFEVSQDGRVYTFRIRPDARFANGRQVVADDFVASWTRALNPNNLSPMVDFMSLLEGFQEYIDRDSEEIGFRVVDDQTVEITLREPFNYFPSYLATFVWAVVDTDVIDEFPEDFALQDSGTGPWRITEYVPDSQIVMEPNPEYYGGVSPSISRLLWTFVTGPDADQVALDLYRDEDAISADVPVSLLNEVQEDESLSQDLVRVEPSGSTRSLAMDFNQPPFNDVRVRRAFALATDRAGYSDIYREAWVPTTGFTPPVVAETSGYSVPSGIEFNADEARRLLDEAGFPDGEELPEITYFQSVDDTEEEIERTAQFLQAYEENLGVTIVHDTSRTQEQIETLRQDEGGLQFTTMWWTAVTETPQLLSYALRPDAPFMQGWFNWNSDVEDQGEFTPGADADRFAELTAQADVEQDDAARNDLYRQAEELVLRNAVYVPIANWVQMFVQKPWLQGTRQGPWTGRLPVLFDADVVVVDRDSEV